MEQYFQLALLSLGAGALYASLAQGLLLTYRSSGVVNFAFGAMAMSGAYVYSELRTTGDLMVPPLPNPVELLAALARAVGVDVHGPNWPTFVSRGGPMATIPAFLLAMAWSAALGLVCYVLVFRPLRRAPQLAKIVASVGLMLTLQAVVVIRFTTNPRSVPPLFPRSTVQVLGVQVPVDRIYLALVAVGLTLAVAAVYRFTRLGWATEAAAEDEKGAQLTGLSPNRLAAVNWTVSALFAGGMGILFSTITALSPSNFTLYVLPALAAVLIGGLRSFTGAAAAAFAIAALQQIATLLQQDVGWLPSTGLAEAIPLVLIVIAILVNGQRLPTRDSDAVQRLPAAPEPTRPLVPFVVVGLAAVAGALWLPFDYRAGLLNSAAGVIIALSLVVLVGLLGQISLMQMALAGFGAVAMTRLAGDWSLPFPLAPILAALAAAALGLLVTLPALRIRGTHLAIVSLAFAMAFEAVVLRSPSVLDKGNEAVPPPSLFGVELGVNDSFPVGRDGSPNPGFVLVVLAIAAIACYLYVNLRRSPLGRNLLAVRSNERAAASAAISVPTVKFAGFAVAACLAGLAGALSAYRFEGVTADSFTTFTSLTVLAMAYLGGIGRLSGALVAGLLITGGLMSTVLRNVFHVPEYEGLFAGLGLVLTAVMNPEGIAGAIAATKAHLPSIRIRRSRPSTSQEVFAHGAP